MRTHSTLRFVTRSFLFRALPNLAGNALFCAWLNPRLTQGPSVRWAPLDLPMFHTACAKRPVQPDRRPCAHFCFVKPGQFTINSCSIPALFTNRSVFDLQYLRSLSHGVQVRSEAAQDGKFNRLPHCAGSGTSRSKTARLEASEES